MFDGKEYPDYVSGTGYVISGALVPSLFDSALFVPLFHLEDVFVTGMVARRANVVPENFHLFSFVKHPTDNACLYRNIITSHGLSPEELVRVWSHIRNRSINCTTVQLPKIGDVKLKKCRKVKKSVPPMKRSKKAARNNVPEFKGTKARDNKPEANMLI